MKKILVFFISVFIFEVAFSQTNRKAECEVCVEGLKVACFNTYGFSSENEFQSFLSTYFNMTDEQKTAYKNSSSTSAGIKAVIDAIPVAFTGSRSTDEDKKEYKRLEILFKENQSLFSSDVVKIYSKLVDANAIRAYENCVTNCIRSVGGGTAIGYNIEGDTNDEFIIVVNWRPTTAMAESKVSSFQSTNLMLKNGANIYNGVTFKAFTPLIQTFKRIDSSKPASITIAFVGLGEPISITIDGEDKLSRYLPIGTIVASVLNYQQFAGQTFDDRKSIWAPSDGRSVSNSKFGMTINPNVPDLRGQFMRGLNQFYSPGEPSTVTNGIGSNDRTIVNQYSYQKQDINKHSHTITDDGHSHSTKLAIVGTGGSGTVSYRPSGFGSETALGTEASKTGIKVNDSDGIETRPNNLAVYFYIKIN